jgi:hypothetical protein
MKFCGPGGIRTLDLFSAIDEQVGEKGEKLSITYNLCQNHHTVLAYLYPNCSRFVPDMHRYEVRKGDPSPVLRGKNF